MLGEKNGDPEFTLYQRQLSLVDQILGLEAALAEEAAQNSPARIHVEQLEAELVEMHASATWRVGRMVLAPLRLLRTRLIPPPKW